jgi:hypothetical protein
VVTRALSGTDGKNRLNGIEPTRSFPFRPRESHRNGAFPSLRVNSIRGQRLGGAGGCRVDGGRSCFCRLRLSMMRVSGCRWRRTSLASGGSLFPSAGGSRPVPVPSSPGAGCPSLQERARPGITSCGSPAGAGEWLGWSGAAAWRPWPGGSRGPVVKIRRLLGRGGWAAATRNELVQSGSRVLRTARPGARSTAAAAPACQAAAARSWLA